MLDGYAPRLAACAVLVLALATTVQAQTSPEAAAASAPSPAVTAPALPPKPSPKVVVIAARSNGGPNVSKEAKSLVETPLARNATIVSFDTYKKAVLAAGHPPRDVTDITTIRSVSAAAGITHAVIVEGSTSIENENGRSAKVNTVEISLIDASTGHVVYTTKRTLSSARLTRSVTTPIVAVLGEKLSLPPELPPPQPEPPVPVVPVPPPPETTPAPTPVAPEPPPNPEPVAPPPEPPPTLAPVVVEPAPVRYGGVEMYPLGELRLGLIGLARQGRISSRDGNASYDGPLLAPWLSGSYFPLAKRYPAKSALRGIGAYGEGYLTGSSTHFDAAGTKHSGAVGGFELGGAYKVPVTLNERGPTVTLQLGYAYSAWPLSGVVFPGVRYSSPELGFVADVPLVRHLALFVGGKFMPWLSMGNQARRLGKPDGAYAFRGELGVRIVLAPFELVLAGRYQQYVGDFTGVSNLGLASELGNVHFVDRYYGGSASLGYNF